jgi:hypothetical protein
VLKDNLLALQRDNLLALQRVVRTLYIEIAAFVPVQRMHSTNRRALLGISDDQPTVFETSDQATAFEISSASPVTSSAPTFSHDIDSSPVNMRASLEAIQRNMPQLSISGVAEGGSQRILQKIADLQHEISQSSANALDEDISQQMATLQNQILKLVVHNVSTPTAAKSNLAPSSLVSIESQLGRLEKTIGCPETICMYPDLWSAVTELHRRIDLMNPETHAVIKAQLEQLETEMTKVRCWFAENLLSIS